MSNGENGILVLGNDNRKRRKASGLPHKIIKTYKGKLGQKTSHIARSKRTHTTLPRSSCVSVPKPQKTGVLAVRRIDNRDSKAVFCARVGYPHTITCIYLNNLENIRAGARLISARS